MAAIHIGARIRASAGAAAIRAALMAQTRPTRAEPWGLPFDFTGTGA